MRAEVIAEKQDRLLLAFSLSAAEFGLDVSCVREVLKPQEIHPLPRTPQFVEGVINLRGHIIAVTDLRKKLDMKAPAQSSEMRIIICRIKNFIAGLIVDNVSEVISLPQDDITLPPPQTVSNRSEDGCIAGIANIDGRVITILNPDKILTAEDIRDLSQIKE